MKISLKPVNSRSQVTEIDRNPHNFARIRAKPKRISVFLGNLALYHINYHFDEVLNFDLSVSQQKLILHQNYIIYVISEGSKRKLAIYIFNILVETNV